MKFSAGIFWVHMAFFSFVYWMSEGSFLNRSPILGTFIVVAMLLSGNLAKVKKP